MEDLFWEVRKVKLIELRNWDKNPRIVTKDKVKDLDDSLTRLNNYEVLVADIDGTILSGNARLRLFKKKGIKETEVKFPSRKLTQEEIDEIGLRANLHSGTFDNDKLANEFEEELLRKLDFDLEFNITPKNASEDDFTPPPEAKYDVKRGDIFLLGKHKLMCGDAINFDDIEALLDGNLADMIFTDPPYLMGFEGNVHSDGSKSQNSKFGKIKNDKMSKSEGDSFILDIFSGISTYVKGSWYVCFYRLGLDYIFRALDTLKMKHKAVIIWDKGNHTLSSSDYMSKYEPIVYGYNKEHNFYGDRSNFDIWNIDRTAKNDLHPTMKPIELCAKAINNSSKGGGIVLDLFGGSGSTLIACEQLDRSCHMMELDPYYCSVIIERWEKFTKKKHEQIK